MTKRTRISKKAQRRRRREWRAQAVYNVFWDQVYGGKIRIAAGIDWALSGGDTIAVVPFAMLPDGTFYVPYDHLRTSLDYMVKQIKALEYSFVEQMNAEGKKIREIFQAMQSESAWSKFMQQAIADSLHSEGSQE